MVVGRCESEEGDAGAGLVEGVGEAFILQQGGKRELSSLKKRRSESAR